MGWGMGTWEEGVGLWNGGKKKDEDEVRLTTPKTPKIPRRRGSLA